MSATDKQATGSWPLPIYFSSNCVVVFGFLGALYLLCNPRGRAELRSGIWISPTLLAVPFVAYLGEYVPDAARGLFGPGAAG